MSRHCRHGVAADACGHELCTAEETIKFLRGRVRELQARLSVARKGNTGELPSAQVLVFKPELTHSATGAFDRRVRDGRGRGRGVITNKQADILAHTSKNERYVIGPESREYSEEIAPMVEARLMLNHGTFPIFGDSAVLSITMRGRMALVEWQASQPAPPPISKRKQKARERWRRYMRWKDAWGGSFREWIARQKAGGEA